MPVVEDFSKDLLNKMLIYEESARMSWKEVFAIPFFADVAK